METTGIRAPKIRDLAFDKFYKFASVAVRGLSKKEVAIRVQNAWSCNKGRNIFAQLESPQLCKVRDADLGFLQFNYTWYNDVTAKGRNFNRNKNAVSGIERVIGWAHPKLRVLLKK
ncbi:unnamed protein product [Phytophthora fragariaefolia]|uniref:Unnamed protein product n=1 Tax=Phytophthora fragariaefolia TaxID=1490495 RepID=A0A9W6Y8U0_9STRA|nr:unnamed protein product [Phytophthora fragariaefolia]